MIALRRAVCVVSTLCAALTCAQPQLSAAEPAPTLADSDILGRAALLSVEDRRYLVYLYARLDRPKVAIGLADSILAENPADRQTMLVLASMYVEQKNPQEVLRIARIFLEFYPGDHQGRYFLGAGHYLAKQFAEANQVLRELKREQFIARKYPYETDLAASAFAAGDWYRAMLSYQELLRHHELSDELRDEVRRVLDGIYREHLPRIEVTAARTRLERAQVWRYIAGQSRHVSDRHWLEVRYTRDDVSLEAAPSLAPTEARRGELTATLITLYNRRYRTEVWAGVSGEGALGGGRVRVTFAPQRELSLEIAGNVRANDSLILEALDGRQHHAAATVSWLVEADLTLVVRTQIRSVQVGGEELGTGRGIDLNVDQTFWRQGPRVIAGYRGSIASFDAKPVPPALAAPIADPAGGLAAQTALMSNLVSARINRHGLNTQVMDNLADAWVYRLSAGVDYDFELGATSWNGAFSLTFFPRKSIELTAEGGYTSSAGASNAGSAATLLNFFVRTYY